MNFNDLINENLVILDLDCTNKNEVIETLVNLWTKTGY